MKEEDNNKINFIAWNVSIVSNLNPGIAICAWDFMLENRNAFVVRVNNYPIAANGTLVISSNQCGKKFKQNLKFDFGGNAGNIYVHQNVNAK